MLPLVLAGETKMKILFIIYFAASLMFLQETSAFSRSNFKVTQIRSCSKDNTTKFYINISTEKGNQYLDFDITLHRPLDEDVGTTCDLQSTLDGKTYISMFIIREKDLCKGTNTYLGEFWYDIQRAAQFTPGSCPIPAVLTTMNAKLVISNGELFETWRKAETSSIANSKETKNLMLSYIRSKIGDTWPAENLSSEVILLNRIKGFCSTMDAKWKAATRSYLRFVASNESWMKSIFAIPPELLQSSTSSGRKKKEFSSCSERSKKRKVKSLIENSSGEEIVFAAKTVLRSVGKRVAAEVVSQVTELSPNRPIKIRKAFREWQTAEGAVIPYTEDEGLALLADLRMSKRDYIVLRNGSIKHNAQKLYPSYERIKTAKKRCYPEGFTVDDSGAYIPLQNLLNHTTERIIEASDFQNLDANTILKIELICKYGCDGSSGHNSYMQKPKNNTLEDDDYEDNSDITDANLFLFSLVPLRLVATTTTNSKLFLWKNPKPSSTRFCRPIKFKYMKESAELIQREVGILQNEIKALVAFEGNVNGNLIQVYFTLYLTMVDGKVVNALTQTSSQTCYICKCKPTQMNNLANLKKNPINEDNLQYGLSSLHAWIKFLECILHIAYKLELKAPTVRGASKMQRDRIEARKSEIQRCFWKETGLKVDQVSQGAGTSNTGNVARRFFSDPKKTSEITGVDEKLIKRFSVILAVISSGYEIKAEKFDEFTSETAKLFVDNYGWYRMPVSVHKILIHGAQAVQHLLLPIGVLSEEAQEASNKNYKRIREHHTRKFSRQDTTQDLLRMLLIYSDPVISTLRSFEKSVRKELPEEALELIDYENESTADA